MFCTDGGAPQALGPAEDSWQQWLVGQEGRAMLELPAQTSSAAWGPDPQQGSREGHFGGQIGDVPSYAPPPLWIALIATGAASPGGGCAVPWLLPRDAPSCCQRFSKMEVAESEQVSTRSWHPVRHQSPLTPSHHPVTAGFASLRRKETPTEHGVQPGVSTTLLGCPQGNV